MIAKTLRLILACAVAACIGLDAGAGGFLKGPRAGGGGGGGGTGTAIVSWRASIIDGDGAALSDLANYKAYCGTSSGSYSQNSGLLSTSTLTYTFTSLASGTWYCTVAAVDASGNESLYGIEVSKVVP